jgi:hypothetical protein
MDLNALSLSAEAAKSANVSMAEDALGVKRSSASCGVAGVELALGCDCSAARPAACR